MTSQSWTEVQTLGIDAASGAGVPPAQALAFGAMVARHLADGGPEAPIVAALEAPQSIFAMALRVERVIEAASMGATPVSLIESDLNQRAMLFSWLSGLPCYTELRINGNTIEATLTLPAPSERTRPDQVPLSATLESQMRALAARVDQTAKDATRSATDQIDLD